jgi:DNA-binding MarR family transcriptional regulator
LRLAIFFVHNARMNDWSDDIHAVFLRLSGFMNRPDLDAAFLARAGVKLDRALFPLLSRIGLFAPISVVELANIAGRDHSTVSRQVAKLEAQGLIDRCPAADDQRVRLLTPSKSGQAMLREFANTRRKFLAQQLSDWPDEDRIQFLNLLEKFAAKVETIGGGPQAGR